MSKDKTNEAEETLKAFQEAANAALADRDAEIAALKSQLSAGSGKSYKNAVPVTVNGLNYLVVHGILFEGKKLSPAEIADTSDLVELLIENKSSAVQLA